MYLEYEPGDKVYLTKEAVFDCENSSITVSLPANTILEVCSYDQCNYVFEYSHHIYGDIHVLIGISEVSKALRMYERCE